MSESGPIPYGSRISLLTDIRVMLATARVVVQATGR